jgi:hypothetical protein
MLQAPRVPVLAEDLEMKKLINTYGKTFHTWQVDRGDTLPLGTPLPLHSCLCTYGSTLLSLPLSQGVLACDCTTLFPQGHQSCAHVLC